MQSSVYRLDHQLKTTTYVCIADLKRRVRWQIGMMQSLANLVVSR